jgi:hypothetical protein
VVLSLGLKISANHYYKIVVRRPFFSLGWYYQPGLKGAAPAAICGHVDEKPLVLVVRNQMLVSLRGGGGELGKLKTLTYDFTIFAQR